MANIGEIAKTKDDTSSKKVPTKLKQSDGLPYYSFNPSSFTKDGVEVFSHLVEKTSDKIVSSNIVTQTDFFVHRPPSPSHVPKKTGIDRYTQVDDVRELFHFDDEVVPILDVITKKTIEQSLVEIMREEELKHLMKTQKEHLAMKSEIDEWTQKIIFNSVQDKNSKVQVVQLAHEQYAAKLRLKKLLASFEMMRQVQPNILDESCQELYANKSWKDPDTEAVDKYIFRDGILEKAVLMMKNLEVARKVLDG
jgi:hypothetical protein